MRRSQNGPEKPSGQRQVGLPEQMGGGGKSNNNETFGLPVVFAQDQICFVCFPTGAFGSGRFFHNIWMWRLLEEPHDHCGLFVLCLCTSSSPLLSYLDRNNITAVSSAHAGLLGWHIMTLPWIRVSPCRSHKRAGNFTLDNSVVGVIWVWNVWETIILYLLTSPVDQ